MASRIDCEVTALPTPDAEGKRTGEGMLITREKRWVLGPAEGAWWLKFAPWVIPIGLALILTPTVILAIVLSIVLYAHSAEEAPAPSPYPPGVEYEQSIPPPGVTGAASSQNHEITLVIEEHNRPTINSYPASPELSPRVEVITKTKRVYRATVRPR